MSFEQFHVGLEVLLTVVIPLGLWSLRHMRSSVERIADEKAGEVKRALQAHDELDTQRFEKHEAETAELMGKIDALGTDRQEQHVENQIMLARMDERLKAQGDRLQTMNERLADIS